jgi:serine/threonine-protein kinase RsbW
MTHSQVSHNFTLRNRLTEIPTVSTIFGGFCVEQRVSDKLRRKLMTALDELLNNVISYAYTDDAEHTIEVKLKLAGPKLTLTLRDDGVAFNPLKTATADTDQSLTERTVGGLGIHLVRKLAHGERYQRRADSNELELVFLED